MGFLTSASVREIVEADSPYQPVIQTGLMSVPQQGDQVAAARTLQGILLTMIAMTPPMKKSRRSTNDFTAAEDDILIQGCLEGESAAWNGMVDRYRRLIYSIPVQLGLSEADADDVFQAVFLTLLRFLKSLRDRTRLSAWLITTTRRECYRLVKRRRRDGRFPIELFEHSAEGESIDEQNERWERQQLVRQAMEKLNERDRRLVLMLFLESGTPNYEAISEELGMRMGSIGPTRARVLAKLQGILADLGWEGDAARRTPVAARTPRQSRERGSADNGEVFPPWSALEMRGLN